MISYSTRVWNKSRSGISRSMGSNFRGQRTRRSVLSCVAPAVGDTLQARCPPYADICCTGSFEPGTREYLSMQGEI